MTRKMKRSYMLQRKELCLNSKKKIVKRPNMQSLFNTNKNKSVSSAPSDSGVQPSLESFRFEN